MTPITPDEQPLRQTPHTDLYKIIHCIVLITITILHCVNHDYNTVLCQSRLQHCIVSFTITSSEYSRITLRSDHQHNIQNKFTCLI